MSKLGNNLGAVVVTGGSRGIGAAVARLVAAKGYAVVVNYAHDEDAAQAVVTQLTEAGGRAVAIRADMASEADIVALFAQSEAALGPLYGLVNNVGISGGFSRVADLSAATLAEVLAVNVAGPFLCAREAVRRLSTALGGRIKRGQPR